MVILGILLIMLQIGDIITTNIGIKRGCVEGNLFLKKPLRSGFPLYLSIIKILIAIFLTFILTLGIPIINYIVLIDDIFMFIVVINNIIVIKKLGSVQ